jgi:short-subunit dehydrogenase
MDVAGATVVVTGGTGGIGAAVVSAFRGAGAQAIAVDLPGRGGDVDLDVTDRTKAASTIEELRPDIVVANAGIGIGGALVDLDAGHFQRSVDVNVMGVVNTLLPALPHMRANHRGAVVLMASLSGLVPTPLLTPYSMTKFAIVGLGHGLRVELAPDGIGVTVVCPGPVETSLLDVPSATRGASARRYLTAAAGKPIAPGALADRVVRAVIRDEALVVPGRARLLARLQRWTPGVVERQIAKNMRAELAAASATPDPAAARPHGAE